MIVVIENVFLGLCCNIVLMLRVRVIVIVVSLDGMFLGFG